MKENEEKAGSIAEQKRKIRERYKGISEDELDVIPGAVVPYLLIDFAPVPFTLSVGFAPVFALLNLTYISIPVVSPVMDGVTVTTFATVPPPVEHTPNLTADPPPLVMPLDCSPMPRACERVVASAPSSIDEYLSSRTSYSVRTILKNPLME